MTKTKGPAGLVPVRLDLAPADRDRLKVAAAVAGIPMSQYTREAVLRALDADLKVMPKRKAR